MARNRAVAPYAVFAALVFGARKRFRWVINIHDENGVITHSNRKLSENTGYSANELARMHVWELDAILDREDATSLWAQMDVGDSKQLKSEYVRADSSTFPVEIHVRRIKYERVDRFVAISRETASAVDPEKY